MWSISNSFYSDSRPIKDYFLSFALSCSQLQLFTSFVPYISGKLSSFNLLVISYSELDCYYFIINTNYDYYCLDLMHRSFDCRPVLH